MLGHFATREKWINGDMVNGFEVAMDDASKTYTNHWYDAYHAFANMTSARYEAKDAALSWDRTLAFLAANLK